MPSDTPHTMHVIVDNIANANQLWETLWSEKEPGNTANGQTFNIENAYRDTNTPGAGPDAWIINSPCTVAQKAEIEEFMSGTNPARWLLERSAGQLNTWRSNIVAYAFDQDHKAFVDATTYVPADL